MNLREALRWASERLEQAEIADAKTDSWLLLQHVTGIRRAEYFLSPEKEMSDREQEMFLRLVEERAGHRPLQHITGTQEFMGFTFRVNEHVLIPRQDTEILAEKAIRLLKAATGTCRILDLCTGSGCIAVSLAAWAVRNSRPVKVTATDLSEEALHVARANAETILKREFRRKRDNCDFKAKAEVAGTAADEPAADKTAGVTVADAEGDESADHLICFRRGDLFEAVGGETFSMILSNPPYIRTDEIKTLMPEVRDFEPRMALDGAGDGLAFYRRIAAEAPSHLEQGGRILLEIGYDEACAVSELLTENGFCDIQILKDYAGLDRVVCGRYEAI